MKRENLVLLIEVAIMAAVAFVLGYIKLYSMPNGGSVSLEMLPIVIMAFRRGIKAGVITGLLMAILQMSTGGHVLSFIQIMFDYIIAFSVIGFASMFGKSLPKAVIGIAVVCFIRFLCHVYIGVQVWEATWWVSVVYNGPYMFFSSLVVILAYIPLSKNKQIMNP